LNELILDYILNSGGNNTSEVLNLLLHIPKNLISPDELIEASLKFRITKVDIEQIRAKMTKTPVSPSNSKPANRPKFNFDVDVRGHFLFLKMNNLGKSKEFQKSCLDASDFSLTTGSVTEVVENNVSPFNKSDSGLPKLAVKSSPKELVVSNIMEDSSVQPEVEKISPSTKSLEKYASSSPSQNSVESLIIQEPGT
jgi:hypothetical protein